MEEELKIKPCPYCGNTQIDYYNVPYASFFGCSNCGLCGPRELYKDNAALAWNVLPRRMKWTREKPTVPGWYWFYGCEGCPKFIVHIKGFTKRGLLLTSGNKRCILEGNWAGPIQEPEESHNGRS